MVNGVLLQPLPYPHAKRLVNVWSTAPGLELNQFPLSPDLFLFYRRHNQVFEDMALLQNRRLNLTEGGSPEVVDGMVTTHSYFATLGVGLSRGRAYAPMRTRLKPLEWPSSATGSGRAAMAPTPRSWTAPSGSTANQCR